MSWDPDVSHLRCWGAMRVGTQPLRAGLNCDAPTALRSSAQLVGEASFAKSPGAQKASSAKSSGAQKARSAKSSGAQKARLAVTRRRPLGRARDADSGRASALSMGRAERG